MQSNCIKNLLNLKEVIIKSVKNLDDCVEISVELPITEQICPCCGSKTSYVGFVYLLNPKLYLFTYLSAIFRVNIKLHQKS